MKTMLKKHTFIHRYSSFALVFAPFLFPYFFPGTTTNLETVWVFLNGLVFLGYNFYKRIKPISPLSLKFFLTYSLLIPVYGYTIFGNSGGIKSSWATIIPFVLFLINAVPLLSWKHIQKYYRILVYCSIVFFAIQEVMFNTIGYRATAYVPFLPISYDYTTTYTFSAINSFKPRSMSFFLEPAHLAQYILGYLALSLGNDMTHGKFFGKESIFITIILILTWSGNAIMGSIILWLIYIIYCKSTLFKKSIIITTAIIAALISFSYIVSTEKGEKLLDRQEELSMDQARISSGTLRIFRGFFVYSKIPFDEQLLGVGTGYTPQVIDQNPYAWMFDANEYYINSAQTLLIGTGIFGTTIFLIFLIKLTRCKSPYPKLFIALLITLMLIESLYCSGRMLIYLTIAMYTYYHSIRTVKNKPICKHLKLENI